MSAVVIPMPNVTVASPQVEDGFTRISNELLGALAVVGLGAAGWDVIAVVTRKTYGFNKKADELALSQVAAMLGRDEAWKGNISKTINTLISRRILVATGGVHARSISINKDYTQWEGMTPEKVATVRQLWRGADAASGVMESITPNDAGGYEIYNSGVMKSITQGLSDLQPQKTTPKENSKRQKDKTICAPQADRGESDDDGARADQQGRAVTAPEGTRAGRNGRAVTVLNADQQKRFERFYAAYPRKRSRIAAEKAFAKLDPDDALLAELLAGIDRAKTTEQWRDPTKIPYPASWLNAGAWEDEISTAYSPRELEVIESFNDTLGGTMGLVDTAVYSERRAGAIRAFLLLSEKPNFWTRFFPWIRDNCTLPPYAGFEWLMKPETVTSLRGGQFAREQGR